MKAFLFLAGLLAASGCSVGVSYDPSASGRDPAQVSCESRSGYWNRTANVCESPLYRW